MGDVMDIEVVSAIQLPDVERMRGFGGGVSSDALHGLS
jgi:hypothetical protein